LEERARHRYLKLDITTESMKLIFSCVLYSMLLLAAPVSHARPQSQPQSLPMSSQSLANMDEFRLAAGNWRIVGGVSADLYTEKDLHTQAGDGILVNIPSDGKRDNLFTGWEHGDMELELEFMMPKGSNAGIYLQGRYEIQLFDSWGVPSPTFADAGGIYERWDPTRPDGQQGYQGHPPSMNVSRAPGLWQHFQIHFQAPRFDDNGHKIANAKMVKVVQNGVVIHENVELTGPTRAAAFQDEQAMGPLMIQGDHGPVAIRNIRYKQYQPNPVSVSNVRFQSAEGDFNALPDLTKLTSATGGEVDGIDWRASGVRDQFAMRFTGDLHVPYDGLYQFQLMFDWVTGDPHYKEKAVGAGELVIGGQSVLQHAGKQRTVTGEAELKAGTHPFSLSFFKNKPGQVPSVALYVEGGGTPLQSLNAPGSVAAPRFVPSITVEATSEPEVIRGFVQHDGKKKIRTIAVGHPSGVHYTLDLAQGALLQAWKGDFIETTDMWHSRGTEQLAVPLGSVLDFSGKPTVARLASQSSAWPDSMGMDYTLKGYELDRDRLPSFMYTLGDVSVTDHLFPEDEGRILVREVTLVRDAAGANAASGTYWVRVASGAEVSLMPDRNYSIDGRMYYVNVLDTGGGEAVVRASDEGQELLIPISLSAGSVTVRYALIW